jgi:uncharacterized protein (UPF0248 family)
VFLFVSNKVLRRGHDPVPLDTTNSLCLQLPSHRILMIAPCMRSLPGPLLRVYAPTWLVSCVLRRGHDPVPLDTTNSLCRSHALQNWIRTKRLPITLLETNKNTSVSHLNGVLQLPSHRILMIAPCMRKLDPNQTPPNYDHRPASCRAVPWTDQG